MSRDDLEAKNLQKEIDKLLAAELKLELESGKEIKEGST